MTKWHVLTLGVAAAFAGVALFSQHTEAGLGFATSIVTGTFGHMIGTAGQRRRDPSSTSEMPTPGPRG